MKLVRYGRPGHEKPGLLLPDGQRIDASACVHDYDEAFFGGDGGGGHRATLPARRRRARAIASIG